MPRLMACWIHQVAYVENLKPLRQSNLVTACIKPRLPSWMRSRSGMSVDWYLLAIDTTSRRLALMNCSAGGSVAPRGPAELALPGGHPSPRPRARSSVASWPAWMAFDSRHSSSLVSSGYLPMPSRYRRTRSCSRAVWLRLERPLRPSRPCRSHRRHGERAASFLSRRAWALCQTEKSVVAVAQLVRAPGCGPGGRGFKSPRSPHHQVTSSHRGHTHLPQIPRVDRASWVQLARPRVAGRP